MLLESIQGLQRALRMKSNLTYADEQEYEEFRADEIRGALRAEVSAVCSTGVNVAFLIHQEPTPLPSTFCSCYTMCAAPVIISLQL